MQFASATEEQISAGYSLGCDAFTLGGMDYVKESVLYETFDFSDGTIGISAIGNGNNSDGNKVNVDLSSPELSSIPNIESEKHGKVLSIGGDGTRNCTVFNGSSSSGMIILSFDIYNTGNFRSGQSFSYKDTKGWIPSAKQQFKFFGNELQFTNDEDVTETIATLSPDTWYNFSFLYDADNLKVSFALNGDIIVTQEGVLYKEHNGLAHFEIMTPAVAGEKCYFDNFTAYRYLPVFNITSVKSADYIDGRGGEVNFENGTDIKITFNTAMRATDFTDDVLLSKVDGKDVRIKDIDVNDYDTLTKSLTITTEEALQPYSKYKIILKCDSVNDNGEKVFGVVGASGYSMDEDFEFMFTTFKTEYGVEVSAPVSVVAGSSASVTVDVRNFATSVDSNIVLALYVDGKLRSIDSESISAGGASANYTFNLAIPADDATVEEKYEIRALLLGADYNIIDVIDVPIAQ